LEILLDARVSLPIDQPLDRRFPLIKLPFDRCPPTDRSDG